MRGEKWEENPKRPVSSELWCIRMPSQ